MKKNFYIWLRRLITRLEYQSRAAAFKDYSPTQLIKDLDYYKNQLKHLEVWEEKFGKRDRYLEEERIFIENRIWELSEEIE